MFSFSGLSVPSFEPGVVVPIDGLVDGVFGNDPGAVADEFAEYGCGHVGDQLLEGAESSEPGDTNASEAFGQVSGLDGLSGGEPGEQPRRTRMGGGVHVATLADEFGDEQREAFWKGQMCGTNMEPHFVALVLEVADCEGANAGDRLGEEQDK